MDHQTGGDLESSVDDFCLAGHNLALDLHDGLRWIPTDRCACAGLRRRPDLGSGDRIDSIHRTDMPVVEIGRVIEEEIDLIELLFLDVEDGVRERVELPGVVPVTMS